MIADGTVRYSGNQADVLRSACHRGFLDNGQARCIAFRGTSVDEAIAQEVLRVEQLAAVEAAVLASEEEARKRDDVLQALRRDLEAARFIPRGAHRNNTMRRIRKTA